MLQVHGSIHHEGKNSTRGVEKAVSNSAQYREWLSYLVSGMARAVTEKKISEGLKKVMESRERRERRRENCDIF